MTTKTGYAPCKCNDCFEIAIPTDANEGFCHECDTAGCCDSQPTCSATCDLDEDDTESHLFSSLHESPEGETDGGYDGDELTEDEDEHHARLCGDLDEDERDENDEEDARIEREEDNGVNVEDEMSDEDHAEYRDRIQEDMSYAGVDYL